MSSGPQIPELPAHLLTEIQPIETPYMKRIVKAAEDRGREAERAENVDFLLRMSFGLKTESLNAGENPDTDDDLPAPPILSAAFAVEQAAEAIATRKERIGG
jgi:hypothetical protein